MFALGCGLESLARAASREPLCTSARVGPQAHLPQKGSKPSCLKLLEFTLGRGSCRPASGAEGQTRVREMHQAPEFCGRKPGEEGAFLWPRPEGPAHPQDSDLTLTSDPTCSALPACLGNTSSEQVLPQKLLVTVPTKSLLTLLGGWGQW